MGDGLEDYPVVGGFRCRMRGLRQMISGNVVELFVPIDLADCDAVLALGKREYKDALFYVTVHHLQDAAGADLARRVPETRTEATPTPGPVAEPGKPYGQIATLLYRRGFFDAPQVRKAIGGPVEAETQGGYAKRLAEILGFASMGFAPPDELVRWTEGHGLTWMLPAEYREWAGVDEDEIPI